MVQPGNNARGFNKKLIFSVFNSVGLFFFIGLTLFVSSVTPVCVEVAKGSMGGAISVVTSGDKGTEK